MEREPRCFDCGKSNNDIRLAPSGREVCSKCDNGLCYPHAMLIVQYEHSSPHCLACLREHGEPVHNAF